MKQTTLIYLLLIAASTLAANPRPLGDSRIVAPFGFPGYPEGIAVHEGRIYVSGPAAFGVPSNFEPSKIFVYSQEHHNLVDTIVIKNQNTPLKAISCITFDENDNLYVLDEGQGVLKINIKTKTQSVYAAPFYPVFQSAFNPPAPVLLNDLAFDKNGYLYITDSFQATIWRVAPGGGAPTPWFTSAAIDGPFGPNGIRIDAKSQNVYFAQTFNAQGAGFIYTLPIKDHPVATDLKIFHTFEAGAGPDGFAFGKSGKMYVALAGASKIAVLAPNGAEITRYSGPANGPNNTSIVWANPANIAFDNSEETLLVTNHASLTGLPDPSPLFIIFDVFVNDKAGKLFEEFEKDDK